MTDERIPFALCAYSLPHVMGYLKTRSGEQHPAPMTPLGLMDAAVEMKLAGVEFALSALVPSFEGAWIDTGERRFDPKEELEKRRLRFVADYGVILDNDAQHLRDYLRLAAETGAKVVRAVISPLLCGDRRRLEGGWEAYLDRIVARLKEILPEAEEHGICIALENHQDATSDDLLQLAERVNFSPSFGVTLDTGNPLAVGEDPVEYTERIAPLIRHIHIKDYTIHFAPEGYRLARCVAGQGVIDFPTILRIVHANGHDVLPANEVAAQATRTIALLESDWWAHYPSDHARYLVPALRLLWAKGRPFDEPYASAWERGADSAMVAAEEWDVVRRSSDYLHSLAQSLS